MILRITKTFKFESAHRLPYHQGPCKNDHGHSYKLEVTVEGEVRVCHDPPALPDCGMVMDFSDLKSAVEANVISKLDHQNLNSLMVNPTAENLIMYIHRCLVDSLGSKLVRLKLWETEGSYVEWETSYE